MTMFTGTTCGWACWYAREDACRCSCGGAAHGSMLVAGAAQPRRNCTIQGVRYVLGAVDGYAELEGLGRKFRETLKGDERFTHTYGNGYEVVPHDEKRGATWRKTASDAQAKWSEVAAWPSPEFRPWVKASLLWIREDAAELFDAWLEARMAVAS